MATKIIHVADPHLTDKAPRRRRDNYQETQLRKLRFLFDLAAQENAAAIAISGDLFDNPIGRHIKRSLDTMLMAEFKTSPCPIVHIRGNHDVEHGRLESLSGHPLGLLEAAGIILPVHWPFYLVVGDEPKVLVMGKDYTPEGPKAWLQELGASDAVREEKISSGAQYVFALTHCFWGEQDGEIFGRDAVVGYDNIVGTGIDVIGHGHDHKRSGIVSVGDQYIVGPGALLRGSLADEDIYRIPAVALLEFSDTIKIRLVDVPHAPNTEVFDLEWREKEKKAERTVELFSSVVKRLREQSTTIDEMLENLNDRVDARVMARVDRYVKLALERES